MKAQAYFDESGTGEESQFLCIGGYIFENDNATNLDTEWQKLLKKYQLPYFHMSECNAHKGVYAHLSKKECDDSAREASELIKTYASHGIAMSLDKSAAHLLPPDRGLYKGQYALICCQVLYAVRDWADMSNFSGEVAYFFESGADGAGQATDAMGKIKEIPRWESTFRLASFSFVDKRYSGAVQAADMLVWHWLKENRRNVEGKKIRPDFRNLLSVKTNCRHYDEIAINKYNAFVKTQGPNWPLTEDGTLPP